MYVAIKIDVDTHDGMRDGVPRLLDCLKKHQVPATFFLVMGPDRMGRALLQLRHPRFLKKMLTTNAPGMYGWRTIFSGTLLPARPVATAFPDLVRRLAAEGHEAAVHAWDHRAWQDELPQFKTHRIRLHLERAATALSTMIGHHPAGIGAPAWTTTPESLAIQDAMPFTYASDLRASPPCRLQTPLGEMRLPQLPGTGLCLEELLGLGLRGEQELADRLLHDLDVDISPLRVLTLHAEVEGGRYLPVLDRILPVLKQSGQVVTMVDAARQIGPLPLRHWCRKSLAGRAFSVTSSVAPALAGTDSRL
ncbi:MAG: polysaccharide deacetylase family protein [Planctomycetota bacterium]